MKQIGLTIGIISDMKGSENKFMPIAFCETQDNLANVMSSISRAAHKMRNVHLEIMKAFIRNDEPLPRNEEANITKKG